MRFTSTLQALACVAATAAWFIMSSASNGAGTAGNTAPVGATAMAPETSPQALVGGCLSMDESIAAASVARLRELGQLGLDALCEAIAAQESQQPTEARPGRFAKPAAGSNPTLERLRKAADAVARQRDASACRLYWFTEEAAAIVAAREAHKPILSLRLLGNLDEDLSCANSRFFRTTLYANAEVAAYLRQHFILHWQSLRPVPRITIDLGNGHRIERTITGNSIHYVLDENGALIDALPGLYGPSAFLRGLQAAEQSALAVNEAGRPAMLRRFHRDAVDRIDAAYAADLERLASSASSAAAIPGGGPAAAGDGRPLALQAAPIAESKMQAEAPMLKAALAAPGDGEAVWERLGTLHAEDARLDTASMSLMRAKMPPALAEQAAKVAMSKRRVEDPFMRAMREFQRSLAADTMRNEYELHREIHHRLATQDSASVAAFNARVYADLFLTPLDDPWMGLAPQTVYAAIDGGGCR